MEHDRLLNPYRLIFGTLSKMIEDLWVKASKDSE